MASVHAVVRGMVQGVGFRWFVQRHAGELGLKGWVRNLPDGSVELEAEGTRAPLERLLELLRRGPAMSRVDAVDVRWGENETGKTGFDITF